jgi:hypothetical protein
MLKQVFTRIEARKAPLVYKIFSIDIDQVLNAVDTTQKMIITTIISRRMMICFQRK